MKIGRAPCFLPQQRGCFLVCVCWMQGLVCLTVILSHTSSLLPTLLTISSVCYSSHARTKHQQTFWNSNSLWQAAFFSILERRVSFQTSRFKFFFFLKQIKIGLLAFEKLEQLFYVHCILYLQGLYKSVIYKLYLYRMTSFAFCAYFVNIFAHFSFHIFTAIPLHMHFPVHLFIKFQKTSSWHVCVLTFNTQNNHGTCKALLGCIKSLNQQPAKKCRGGFPEFLPPQTWALPAFFSKVALTLW